MLRKLIISGGALALLLWLEARKRSPDASISFSSFVVKNGECYRVDLLATGGNRSVPVAMSNCDAAQDPNSGLEDVADDISVGFRELVHLFDDL